MKEDNLLKSYIIGLIDGDGGIYNYDYPIIQLTGNLGITTFVKEKFDLWFPGCFRKKCNEPRLIKNETYSYTVGGKRAERIVLDLRQIPVPKLERKWKKL